MKISYADAEVELLCTSQRAMQRKFGAQAAKKIRRRVNELRSAENWQDVMTGPGRWHPLKHDRAGTYAAEVTGTIRLIVRFDSATDVEVLALGNEYHR